MHISFLDRQKHINCLLYNSSPFMSFFLVNCVATYKKWKIMCILWQQLHLEQCHILLKLGKNMVHCIFFMAIMVNFSEKFNVNKIKKHTMNKLCARFDNMLSHSVQGVRLLYSLHARHVNVHFFYTFWDHKPFEC